MTLKQLRKSIYFSIEYAAHFYVQVEEWKDRDKIVPTIRNLAIRAAGSTGVNDVRIWEEHSSARVVDREARRKQFRVLVMASSVWAKNSTTLSNYGALGIIVGMICSVCRYEWTISNVVPMTIRLGWSEVGAKVAEHLPALCGRTPNMLKNSKLEEGQVPGGNEWIIE